jgi:hypothetical protein
MRATLGEVRLGEMLVRDRLITVEQLETSLRAQVIYGGRLGTNLVELGFVELDELTSALAAQTGVPAAVQQHFEGVDRQTLGLVSAELAGQHQAIPVGLSRLAGRQLVIAFVDPLGGDGVQAIARATGTRVTPCVAPELRILFYLEQLYGIPRKSRFRRVESPDPPLRSSSPVGGSVRPALGASEAMSRINAAHTRDEIADAIVDYLRSAFGCGVVMIVREGLALGWKGFAPGTDSANVESIAMPLGAPSVLRLAHDRLTPFRGPPPEEGVTLQGRLWKLLRVPSPPEEVLVAPVLLRERVVNLIYAHATDGGSLPEAAVVEVSALCSCAATAYARLIQAAKFRGETP